MTEQETIQFLATNRQNAEAAESTVPLAAEYAKQICKEANIPVKVEICGMWVWVTGETKPVKDVLKAAGFWWAKNKQAWYYSGKRPGFHRTELDLEAIRTLHGSTIVG